MKAGWIFLIFIISFPLFAQSGQQMDEALKKELTRYIDQKMKDEQAAREKEVQLAVQELALAEQRFDSNLNHYLIIFGAVLLLVTGAQFLLIRSVPYRFKKQLDHAIYKVNPQNIPVKLPSAGMEKEVDYLDRLSFLNNVKYYHHLNDDCDKDIVIFPATNDQEATVLKSYIDQRELKDSERAIYIVYTRGAHISHAIFSGYGNVTFANNRMTLFQALFVAARGIIV